MASPKTSHSIPPKAQLQQSLSRIAAEIDDQPLKSSSLARILSELFGGSDAGGAWSWRMAYDMMQAAAVMRIVRSEGADPLSDARMLATRLLTEMRRSEAQIRLQQFSTPLPYAALAVRAAAIRTGETVLEPSAGTGALAAFAARAGARLMFNEIDPFRRALLDAVFRTEVTDHDGEHIDDLLATPSLPDVIVMNPPFASSVDRSSDRHIAAKHLIAAAKRLAPGGRLVAIMPPGFTAERDTAHWTRACGIVKPRLALTVPGRVYARLGTSVETQLMVFDKALEAGEMHRAAVADLDTALDIIDEIAAMRPAVPARQPNAKVRVEPAKLATTAVRRRPLAAPTSAARPSSRAAIPLSFTALEIPHDNTPVSDIYARYRPQRIDIAGAREHPTPRTAKEMLTAALGSTAPVDLGRGLTLTRRRVPGAARLEIDGADRGMIESLKAIGCFTEIIAFQLRVFVPHGEGIDTEAILSRITGEKGDGTRNAAA